MRISSLEHKFRGDGNEARQRGLRVNLGYQRYLVWSQLRQPSGLCEGYFLKELIDHGDSPLEWAVSYAGDPEIKRSEGKERGFFLCVFAPCFECIYSGAASAAINLH